MKNVLRALVSFLFSLFRSRLAMQVEILALRHQLAVCQQSMKRPHLRPADRIFWAWLSRLWSGWERVLVFVQPATVIRWRRRKFCQHWAKLSRSGKPGRPPVPKEVRDLIRQMSRANPTWGSPRIRGELAKLGINTSKSTVEKYFITDTSVVTRILRHLRLPTTPPPLTPAGSQQPPQMDLFVDQSPTPQTHPHRQKSMTTGAGPSRATP